MMQFALSIVYIAQGVFASRLAHVGGERCKCGRSMTIMTSQNETSWRCGWLRENGNIMAIMADDKLPDAIREHLRSTTSDILDCVVVAHQTGCILVSDDMP